MFRSKENIIEELSGVFAYSYLLPWWSCEHDSSPQCSSELRKIWRTTQSTNIHLPYSPPQTCNSSLNYLRVLSSS